IELRIIGYSVPEEYELAVRRSLADRNLQKKKRRESRQAKASSVEVYSDAEFSFIAGYTEWGYPYGTLWDENDKPNPG
ncbi:MAG: hypothetical protein KGM98_10590, partial [Bacteroidota bacterium]|nr:hypothetical protein [Bacteroidota bacterium]